MRNGQCKFGSTCKFHHPQPSNMMVPLRGSAVYPPIHSPTTSQLSYPLSRASFIASPRWQSPSSYAPLVMQQGMVSVPGWNTYNVIFLMSYFFFLPSVSSFSLILLFRYLMCISSHMLSPKKLVWGLEVNCANRQKENIRKYNENKIYLVRISL